MRLPGGELARVDRRKLTDYLLSPTHSVGQHKARFFHAAGYRNAAPEQLAAALQLIARHGVVSRRTQSPFATRYIVDGVVEAPSGASVALRTVWIVPVGGGPPEFVTAFPHRFGREA